MMEITRFSNELVVGYLESVRDLLTKKHQLNKKL